MVHPTTTRVRKTSLRTGPHTLRFDAPHRQSHVLNLPETTMPEPQAMRLTSESALQFEDDVLMAIAAGQHPDILIEDIRGLNPEFIRRLLREHPSALLTTQAHLQLSHPLGPQSPHRSRQRTVLTIAAAMLTIATLLIGRLLAS